MAGLMEDCPMPADATVDPSPFVIHETERREGKFAGDDPFALAQSWLDEAFAAEINDGNAMSLATVDETGMPNARMVLLKEIERAGAPSGGAFVFYTNYGSAKGGELAATGKAALLLHWKSRLLTTIPTSIRDFVRHGVVSLHSSWSSQATSTKYLCVFLSLYRMPIENARDLTA